MKALVGAFNPEKALVGALSVIVQPVVEPMEHYTALALNSSRRLFLYFLAGLIRFRALSASSLDFSPTLESLGAGVEGRLFSIPFIGVGLQKVQNE